MPPPLRPKPRLACLIWGLWLLVAGVADAAEPRISDIRVDPDGRARVTIAADTNSYYVLYRGETVTDIRLVSQLGLGAAVSVQLVDSQAPAPATARFYRVEQIPLNQPKDSDGDGVDDVYELQRREFLDPLARMDPAQDTDGDGVSDLEEYRQKTDPAVRNAVAPTVSLIAPTLGAAFLAPGYVTLSANATVRSVGATVTKVEFFANKTMIGEGTPVSVDGETQYQLSWSNVPVGEYVVLARVTDTLGTISESLPTTIRVVPLIGEPLTTLSSSPRTGETGVAVTRETILRFTCPLREDTQLNLGSFHAVANGRRMLSRIQLSSDRRTATLFYLENLPSSTRVRVMFDGAGIFDCLGREIDADGDGLGGGVAEVEFDTLTTTVVPRTAVIGRIFASDPVPGPSGTNFVNRPLKGVTITVDGAEETLRTVTDAQGGFRLEPAPAGRFFVHVDGRTAEGSQWPNGAYYPFVGKAWEAVAGSTANLAGGTGEIFLPLVPADALKPVSVSQDTRITFSPTILSNHPALAGVSITVPANSLVDDSGARGGRVGIAPVAPDRLPEPLPPGLEFPLVITIQTDGARNFDRPVPVRFPNLPNKETGIQLQPGEKSALWSFDHDTGRWEMQGTMTISNDGHFLESDPGTGVRQPGWHGTSNGSPQEKCKPKPPKEDVDLWDLAKKGAKCAEGFLKLRESIRCGIALAIAIGDQIKFISNLIERLEALKAGSGTAAEVCVLAHIALDEATKAKAHINELQICFKSVNPLSKAQSAVFCARIVIDLARDQCGRQTSGNTGGRCPTPWVIKHLCIGIEVVMAILDEAESLLDAIEDLMDKTSESLLDALFQALELLLREICDEPNSPQKHSPRSIDQILVDLRSVQAQLEQYNLIADKLRMLDLRIQSIFEATDSLLSSANLAEAEGRDDKVFFAVQMGATVLRGTSDADGNLRITLPPSTSYQFYEYHSATRLIGQTNAMTSLLGLESLLPLVELSDDRLRTDTDYDGLSDLAEFILGTASNDPDSDGDGFPDGEEVFQGSSPFAAQVAGFGVISSSATSGIATDLAASDGQIAIADGAAGVSVISVVAGENPLRVAQVQTPGSAVAVASAPNLIVVAMGDAGLGILDSTLPADTRLVHQVGVGALGGGVAQAVSTAGGLVFVGTTAGRVAVVEAASGAVFQVFDLGARVEDLSIEGTTLYAYAGEMIHVLPFGGGILGRAGVVDCPSPIGINSANGRGRLFVGGGVAYATHSRGFNAFDVRDPNSPRLLSLGDSQQFGWKHSVGTGSGRVIAVYSPNQAFDGPHNVGLFDSSDLSRGNMDDKFLTLFETPGIARAVSLYNGLAYVADHSMGMSVINFSPPDTSRAAPTGTLEQSVTGEVTIGGFVVLRAAVQDDVQVRNVEFFANGQRIAVDGSFPFEHIYRVSTNLVGASIRFGALATDLAGNRLGITNAPIVVRADDRAPTVAIESPAGGSSFVLSDSVIVRVSAIDNVDGVAVPGLRLELNGVPVSSRRLSRTDFQISAPKIRGNYVLRAVATDSAGNVDASAPVAFAVYGETVSREWSVFVGEPSTRLGEAVSREWSVFVPERVQQPVEAISREWSVHVSEPVLAKEAISREWSIEALEPAAAADKLRANR